MSKVGLRIEGVFSVRHAVSNSYTMNIIVQPNGGLRFGYQSGDEDGG